MEKCIVVAVAQNMAIGKDNSLLWHISEDLKMFKSLTMGSPVIMGRNTYLSIGRPLPGRKNIVVSRGFPEAPEGVVVVPSLEKAYEACSDAEKCFVIGGGMLYKAAIDDVDLLYVTEVKTVCDGADTFFPEIDSHKWKEVSRTETRKDEKSGLEYAFVTYGRA